MGGEGKKMRKRLGQEKSATPTNRHRAERGWEGKRLQAEQRPHVGRWLK